MRAPTSRKPGKGPRRPAGASRGLDSRVRHSGGSRDIAGDSGFFPVAIPASTTFITRPSQAHLLGMTPHPVQRKPVTVIGMPLDMGADRRGVDMGPSAIRYAGLDSELSRVGLDVEDLGNIEIPAPESRPERNKNAKYVREIITACRKLSRLVHDACAQDRIAVVLGGDHSLAMGSILGASRFHDELGLIWFDAHADFNTHRTSPSGNVHGMPLSAVFHYGLESIRNFTRAIDIKPERCALIGVRDTDEAERVMLRKSGIRIYTMEAIDRFGLRAVMEQALQIVAPAGKPYHVSFDVDVMDPSDAPGVGTPAIGGLNYRECLMAMEMLAETPGLTSVDFVEVNPILDEKNVTSKIVVNLLATLLGRRIL